MRIRLQNTYPIGTVNKFQLPLFLPPTYMERQKKWAHGFDYWKKFSALTCIYKFFRTFLMVANITHSTHSRALNMLSYPFSPWYVLEWSIFCFLVGYPTKSTTRKNYNRQYRSNFVYHRMHPCCNLFFASAICQRKIKLPTPISLRTFPPWIEERCEYIILSLIQVRKLYKIQITIHILCTSAREGIAPNVLSSNQTISYYTRLVRASLKRPFSKWTNNSRGPR